MSSIGDVPTHTVSRTGQLCDAMPGNCCHLRAGIDHIHNRIGIGRQEVSHETPIPLTENKYPSHASQLAQERCTTPV